MRDIAPAYSREHVQAYSPTRPALDGRPPVDSSQAGNQEWGEDQQLANHGGPPVTENPEGGEMEIPYVDQSIYQRPAVRQPRGDHAGSATSSRGWEDDRFPERDQ